VAKRPSWGHVSKHCARCGKVGPRIQIGLGWIHAYCRTDEEKKAERQRLAEQSKRQKELARGVPVAHTDHPARHYDRTCPACNAGVRVDECSRSSGHHFKDGECIYCLAKEPAAGVDSPDGGKTK
jgi:hypothetical protein